MKRKEIEKKVMLKEKVILLEKLMKRPYKDDIELNQQENNTFIMRLMDEDKLKNKELKKMNVN